MHIKAEIVKLKNQTLKKKQPQLCDNVSAANTWNLYVRCQVQLVTLRIGQEKIFPVKPRHTTPRISKTHKYLSASTGGGKKQEVWVLLLRLYLSNE